MSCRECNRNCVSFVDLLLRFYQMPELSVKAGTLAWTDIPAFKNMVIKQVMAKLSDKLLTHFFRHSRVARQMELFYESIPLPYVP